MPLQSAARLIVICGLPGSGKTTLARTLEQKFKAMRMCPDDWMEALAIDLYDEAARARVENLQWQLTQRLLTIGQVVIIEWGTWARSERDILRNGARAFGAAVELRFLDEPPDTLYARISARGRERPPISRTRVEDWHRFIERPTDEEFALYDPPLD